MALLKFKFGNTEKLVRFIPPFKQEWTKDDLPGVGTIDGRVPLDENSVEVSFVSNTATAYAGVTGNYGISTSLQGCKQVNNNIVSEQAYGVTTSLLSVVEVSQ